MILGPANASGYVLDMSAFDPTRTFLWESAIIELAHVCSGVAAG